jgi:hypothetical protein
MKILLGLLVLAVVPAVAADVSGNWKVDGEVAGHAVDPSCTFRQQDQKLTGVCKSQAGESPLEGAVEGQKVTWQYDVDYNGQTYTLVFTGTLESEAAMKGGFSVGGADGAFTAKKE